MTTAFEKLKAKSAQQTPEQGGKVSAFDALKKKSSAAPAAEEPENEGVVQSMIRSVANVPLRLGVTAFNALDVSKPKETERDLGYFGKVKPYESPVKEGGLINSETGEVQNPFSAKGFKDTVGAGAEAASFLVGGGGAKTAVQGAFRSGLKTAAKEGAKAGAKSGALAGAGDALQDDDSFAEGAMKTITGATFGAGLGVALPVATSATRKALKPVTSIFGRRAEQAAEKLASEASIIESGAPDARVATKTLEGGKVVTDRVAKEAVRQGIEEADVALIKSSSASDRTKMLKMLDVREKQLTNKRITDRATDVVGDTFVENIAKPIEKLNKEAGRKLNAVATRLAGKRVDTNPAIEAFAENLDGAGVTIRKNGTLNFKNSNFEGLRGAQGLITNVWNRAMRVAKTGDALQAHRLKAYIDEIVNYGVEAEGLSGKAETMLKGLRHAVDEVLDTTFPTYNKINTQFSETIQALNQMGAAIGKRFRLGDTFADAQSGLAMRRILSNTKSRSEILKLLDMMQQVGKKYGVKVDDDVITQANFADLLEKMLGTEAPTSLYGQTERAVEQAGQALGIGADIVRNPVSGTLRAGKYLFDVTRGVNQENKIKALRALLGAPKTVFGKKP